MMISMVLPTLFAALMIAIQMVFRCCIEMFAGCKGENSYDFVFRRRPAWPENFTCCLIFFGV